MSYWVKRLFCWCRCDFQPSALQGLRVLIPIMRNLKLLSLCLKPICPRWATVCSRWWNFYRSRWVDWTSFFFFFLIVLYSHKRSSVYWSVLFIVFIPNCYQVCFISEHCTPHYNQRHPRTLCARKQTRPSPSWGRSAPFVINYQGKRVHTG